MSNATAVDHKHPTSPAHGTRHRDALRLLFILAGGSNALESPAEDEATHLFQSEKRLMAIDFLVRYPDYLADALLDLYEADDDTSLLDVVDCIFANEEPSVRVISMVRWHFGAYQKIETALSTLHAFGLVRPMKLVKDGDNRRYDYHLYPKAFSFLDTAIAEVPDLKWYRDRVRLAMKVATAKSGSKLKGWQYEHEEYSNTPQGSVIPSISDKVKARLDGLRRDLA
jgi:hypothetical protein